MWKAKRNEKVKKDETTSTKLKILIVELLRELYTHYVLMKLLSGTYHIHLSHG